MRYKQDNQMFPGRKESVMEELIKQISDKLGIPKTTARKVVLVTASYLKSKMPQSVAAEIDLILDMKEITEEETRFVGLFKIP